MPLDIIQKEIYTGSINFMAHSCDSLSPSDPYLAIPHLSLHGIGCKHIPPYFASPIVLWIPCHMIGFHLGRFSLAKANCDNY